jgi:hypothetical protein
MEGARRSSGIARNGSRSWVTTDRRRRLVCVRRPRPQTARRQLGLEARTKIKRRAKVGGGRSATVVTPHRMGSFATLAGRANHPAVLAWARLHGHKQLPDAVDVLKTGKGGKTSAYRLWGLGPGGGGVIVKCGSAAALEFERSIYQEVLPPLPLPSALLRLFGSGIDGLAVSRRRRAGVDDSSGRSAPGGAGPMAG